MSNSTEVPKLPFVLRPKRGRIMAYIVCVLWIVAGVLAAIYIPTPFLYFSIEQQFAVAAIGFVIAFGFWPLTRVRLECDASGVHVVNYRNKYRLSWAEILGVRLGAGSSWLILDTSAGRSIKVMGVQSADKDYALQQAQWVAYYVAAAAGELEHSSKAN